MSRRKRTSGRGLKRAGTAPKAPRAPGASRTPTAEAKHTAYATLPQAPRVSVVSGDELMDALRVVFAEEMEGLKAWFDDRASGRAEHLTMDEAALELRCSVATVRRYVASGRLSVVRLGHGGSGRVLIPRSALADMIASSTA